MANGSTDALPRLADALCDVGDRLRQISDELRTIHTDTASTTASTPAPVPPPAAMPPAAAPAAPPFPQTPPVEPVPWYPPPRDLPPNLKAPSLWDRLSRDGAGSRILAWAGGAVTLAGVVLLLVLAIQRGYLGPLPRVLLGAVLGLALAGIGLRLHPNPAARTGAYALAATGIAVLYLDVIAATTLYDYLPPYAGLLVGLAVAGLGIALAGRWDSELLAVFVVVCCAVCAPVLTEGFVPLLLGFLLVLVLATAPVRLYRRWPNLGLAAGLPPVVADLILISAGSDGRALVDPATTAVLCMLTSAVLVTITSIAAVRRDDDQSFALLLIAPVPTMLAAGLLPKAGAAVLPAVVCLLLVTLWALHRAGVLALSSRFAVAAGGMGALAALQAVGTAVDGDARPIALLGGALVLTLLALRLRYPLALVAAAAFGLVGLVWCLAETVPPQLLLRSPVWVVPFGGTLTGMAAAALLALVPIALCVALARLEVRLGDHARATWFTAGFVALYGATATVLSIGLLISPDRTGFLVGHALATVSWTVGALVLLLRGIDSVPLRVAGLVLVAAALAKLVLFDLSSLDGMARVAAFLVAGLVLLGAGARYAKLVASRSGRASKA